MKKKVLITLLLIGLLMGCQSRRSDQVLIKQRYEAYYSEIMNNELFVESSNYFDITTVVNQLGNKEYRYDVIIDNPKIAMYDINALVIENDEELFNDSEDSIMPLIISTSNSPIHLIPFQVNLAEGYVKGIVLSGIVTEIPLNAKVLVTWKDYGEVKTYKEFLEFEIDEATQEVVPEVEPEATE